MYRKALLLVATIFLALLPARLHGQDDDEQYGLRDVEEIPAAVREFWRDLYEDLLPLEQKVEQWIDQKYMTGGWWELRDKLLDMGIIPTATYVTDIQGNATGGKHRKVRYFHNIGVDLIVDFGKLWDMPGSRFHVAMSSRAGNSLSREDIGNVFNVAQLC